MSNRIHQLFGDELAGRIFVAAQDAGESELGFVRRVVDEALPDKPRQPQGRRSVRFIPLEITAFLLSMRPIQTMLLLL